MKRIVISEEQAKKLSSLNDKMDKYAFKSYVKDYIRQLLKDPVYGKPDKFLLDRGLDGETLKKHLEDANLIVKQEKIINSNGVEKFIISYKVPAENFVRKLTRLYNRLFEENIIEGTTLNECDCGGCMGGAGNAAFCNDSAPITPLTKEPLRRKKKVLITQEQLQRLQEEVVMDTPIGDFGYDAPGLQMKKKDPAYNHKNMIKKSFKGE